LATLPTLIIWQHHLFGFAAAAFGLLGCQEAIFAWLPRGNICIN